MSEQKNPAVTGPQEQKSLARAVTELKVSANLMTLDAGLFCIFNAPGSATPDLATGLPGVRVSLPPGPVFRPEAITITAFRDDGWLGGWNGAALVRVTRGPAQILVTIYQAPNATGEAPKMQIIRLAESSALPPLGLPQQAAQKAPAPAAAQAAAPPALPKPAAAAPVSAPVPAAVAPAASAPKDSPASAAAPDPEAAKAAELIAHIQGRADVLCKLGEWMGVPGSKAWIEGFAVSPKKLVGPGDIEYQAVLGRGWLSPWAEGGQYCGSRGMSLPILGLRMRLRGEAAERFDCIVSATFVDGSKVGPLDNGEPAQADSMSPLESFNITLLPRGETPATKPVPAKGRVAAPKAGTAAAKVPAKAAAPAGIKSGAKPLSKGGAKPSAAPAKPTKPAGRAKK